MYKLPQILAITTITGTLLTGTIHSHETPNPDGHVPANVNYGFEVIGRDVLAGIQDGLYTDVWSHKGYAYVGTYQEPDCSRAGVFVVDISMAVKNHADSKMSGAVVAEIKSAPNTRVNDVKVHSITFHNQQRDVLILTEEKCGQLNGNGRKQLAKVGSHFTM